MELPIRFPNEADQIFEEAEAFRRRSPTERFLAIVDLIASGESIMAHSPRRQEAIRLRQIQEDEWQRAHKELFARYGH